MQTTYEEKLSKVLKLLQGSIRAAGYTQTQVDEAIGRRRGYLSHVFQRRVDLKLVDLLRALDVLQVDPTRFFRACLDGHQEERRSLEELMNLVGSQRRGALTPAGGWQVLPLHHDREDEYLMRRVRRAVRSILAETPVGLPYGSNGGRIEQVERVE